MPCVMPLKAGSSRLHSSSRDEVSLQEPAMNLLQCTLTGFSSQQARRQTAYT